MTTPIAPPTVSVDYDDAEAIVRFLSEHLQYDDDDDAVFWQGIVERIVGAMK